MEQVLGRRVYRGLWWIYTFSWYGIGWRYCMIPTYYAESRHQSDSKGLAGLSVCEVGSLD